MTSYTNTMSDTVRFLAFPKLSPPSPKQIYYKLVLVANFNLLAKPLHAESFSYLRRASPHSMYTYVCVAPLYCYFIVIACNRINRPGKGKKNPLFSLLSLGNAPSIHPYEYTCVHTSAFLRKTDGGSRGGGGQDIGSQSSNLSAFWLICAAIVVLDHVTLFPQSAIPSIGRRRRRS